MRRFSLFERNGIFYAQLFNPKTGKFMSGKSTGKRNRDEAAGVAADWLKNGRPTNTKRESKRPVDETMTLDTILAGLRSNTLSPDDVTKIIEVMKDRQIIENAIVRSSVGSVRLIEYLQKFWDYDTSPYIREKRLHGQQIGKTRAKDSTRQVKYWKKYFGDEKRIGEVTTSDLRDFSLWLAEYKVLPKKKLRKTEGKATMALATAPLKTLSAGTINKILVTGTLPLKWAANHNELPSDPGKGLMKFSGTARKRGILTESEVSALFRIPWKHERSKVASMLSMSTGLRAGEVLALQIGDIGKDRLFINHSWSWIDGLKCTKTGKPRVVPLLPVVKEALVRLAESNPHGKDGFIFYGLNPKKPMDYHLLLDGLKEALYSIGIDEEERVRRNIVFHSWRHYFTARMANKLNARTVQRATGHSTEAMLEHYAEHELEGELNDLNKTADEVFGKVIPFIQKTA